ncbi:MAG: Fic family protein [Acidobacteriota bacterium]|nr:Fic family protein [Acidobacteriota bacterium]
MIDPYIDPSSGILINKVRATSQRELDQTEANLVSVRSVLLQRNPTQGNYDSVHLKDIHRYLFQDVYPFAGEFRSVELHKADVLTGRRRITTFTSPSLIDFELNQLFESVSNQHFFQGLRRRELSAKLASLFAGINRVHPFREGNGRAQRQFVRQLCGDLGYKMHWEVISKERLIQASITSAHGELGMMEYLMDEITDTERVQPVATLIRFLERNGYDWNERYIASTRPGQEYSGTFADQNGTNFFFYDDQNRILVGNLRDLPSIPRQHQRITFRAS